MISEKRLEIRHKKALCFLADICDFMEAQIAKWLERSRVSLALPLCGHLSLWGGRDGDLCHARHSA